MKRSITLSLVLSTFLVGGTYAQNVGIAEPAPDSKLDIVQTETTGSSLEITHGITTNAASAVFIKNSGTNRALHVQNLLAGSNIHVARFLQMGNGANANGILVEMNNTTPAGTTGLLIDQTGLGYGGYVLMPAGNTSAGLVLDHIGSGDGLQIYQGGNGDGIYNDVTGGLGLLNVIRNNNFGVASLLTTAGGTGEYVDLDVQDGTGVYVLGVNDAAAPTAGGDVYAFFTNVRTATPTGAGTVFGAALAANQSGVGHGILINHSGAQGRNAEFNVNNAANTEAAIFSIHRGQGSAILAQNQNNAITGQISVIEGSYTGTDADDHTGVYGYSNAPGGYGYGVWGDGGYVGVVGAEASVGALAGVYAVGDVGASGLKPFIIDYPLDPANKMLRHFALESDEVLNVYRGMIQLDATGKATVQLPDYFSAINIDYTYQLTPVGTAQQPYVAKEIEGNSFEVGGAPNTKISWMVLAQRNDPYVQQNPEKLQNIMEKTGTHQGKYLMPSLYNQPANLGLFHKEQKVETPITNIQLPESTRKNMEALDSKQKETPVRPKTATNGIEDLNGTK